MTKNLKQILLAVLVLAGVSPALAYDFEQDGFYYNIKSSTEPFTVVLTHDSVATNLYSGELTLPDVVVHNDTTFTLIEIGADAFAGCVDLTSVTLPETIETIKSTAFKGCTGLTTIIIPNSVTTIGENAFKDCSGLASITIGDAVVTLGISVFEGCANLTTVAIPDSLTTIGENAFKDCTNLTSVSIGSSVQTINPNMFIGCINLTDINVDTENTNYKSIDGVVFDYDANTIVVYPRGKQGNYSIPASVKVIGNGAFEGCTYFNSIIIPNSVLSIGDNSFENCNNVTSLTIGKSVQNIGFTAFQGCTSLTTLNFNAVNCSDLGDESISESIFGTALTEVVIGEEVLTIPAYAFQRCPEITSVTIPEVVKTIGIRAFRDCSGITTVNFNAVDCVTMTDVFGSSVFGSCNAFVTLNIGNDVTNIPTSAFHGCEKLSSVVIPNSVTIIGGSSFKGCSHLTSVAFGNAVTTIKSNAFEDCTSLVSFAIPSTVTEVGEMVLNNTGWRNNQQDGILYLDNWCLGYKGSQPTGTLSLNEGTKGIANFVLASNLNLTKVVLPQSLLYIGEGAFSACPFLVSADLGNSLVKIGEAAFGSCIRLNNIAIPVSTEEIGDRAFSNTGWYNSQSDGILYLDNWCLGYKGERPSGQLVLDGETKGIANGSFSDCIDLTSVLIPNNVKVVRSRTFYGCTNLAYVLIGSSVENIGEQAFAECVALDSVVVITTTPPALGENAFYRTIVQSPIAKLVVACGSIDAYTASDWNAWFENIEEDCSRHEVNVSAETTQGGSVSLSTDEASVGENVLMYVTLDNGYELATIKAYNANDPTMTVPVTKLDNRTVLTYSLTMMPFPIKVEASFVKNSTGIEEEDTEISFYPNPTKGGIYIKADNLKQVVVFNLMGQKIMESTASGNSFECNLNVFGTGVYLMQIETSSGIAIRRVVLE